MLAQRSITALLAATCLSLLIAGCNGGSQEVGSAEPPSSVMTPVPQAANPGKSAQGAMEVKDATPVYEKAKLAYNSSKSDSKLRQAYVDATLALAEANMYAKDLPPRVMYPAALKYYREVLKVDPKNVKAHDSEKTIVDIYKSMGRPVPGEGK